MIITSRYGELDPDRVNRLQWASKSKRERMIVKSLLVTTNSIIRQ